MDSLDVLEDEDCQIIPGLTAGLRTRLFCDCPAVECIWVGEIFGISEGREVVPFKFGNDQYFVFFLSPLAECGSVDFLQEMSSSWADGFKPHPDSRLIKFCRGDARNDFYKPSAWKLNLPGQIFQFSELLGKIAIRHYYTVSAIRQYMFLASDDRLERLYKRIFSRIINPVIDFSFTPISAQLGDFYGYESNQ